MNDFIKKRLTEALFNYANELGKKDDVELANIIKYYPYEKILSIIGKDYGTESDIYHLLLNCYMGKTTNVKCVIDILKEHDIYEKYQYLFNLNEKHH